MYKKILLITSITVITFNINAQEKKKYLEIGGTANLAQDRKREESDLERKGKRSAGAFISAGYKINKNASISASLNYIYENTYEQDQSVDNKGKMVPSMTQKMNIFAPKISLSINKDISEKVNIYVSGGLGVAMFSSVENKIFGSEEIINPTLDNENQFHWSLDVGTIFNMNETVSISLGYGFGYYGKPFEKWDPVKIHTIKSGIRFNF